MAHNIFQILSKYKKQEDYWTAALVYLLDALWGEDERAKSREACADLLRRLCGVAFDVNEKVTFEPQRFYKSQRVDAGSRLDLEITTGNKRVWIEVKDQSSLGPGQIAKYLSELVEYQEEHKSLVLLRLLYGDWKEADKASKKVYWAELYDWLKELQEKAEIKDDANQGNLIRQFLEFLELKGVRIMTKLDKDALENGLCQIKSLVAMLRQVAQEKHFRVLDNKSSEIGIDWFMGFCFELNLKENQDYREFIGRRLRRGRYHVGIDPNDSGTLSMGMKIKDVNLIDKSIIKGKLKDDDLYEDDGWIWCDISLADVFNEPTKAKQLEQVGILFQKKFERLKKIQRLRPGKP